MPTFITTPYDDYYMSWTPGSTEKQERAEQIVQAIVQQCPIEEIEARQINPFHFLD